MNTVLLLVLLVTLLIILARSADLVVSSALSFGHILKIKNFVVGLLVLGFATSSPEITVGVNSAIRGVPQLSLGNLLGATVTLLSLLVGLAILTNNKVRHLSRKQAKEITTASLVMLAPLFLLFDGQVSRADGVLLLVFFLSYLFILKAPESAERAISKTISSSRMRQAVIDLVGGVIILALVSRGVVELALQLGNQLNISAVVVGLIVLSLGTNLPEVSLTLTASKKDRGELILGDLIGSASVNTFVLGLVAVINPIQISSPTSVALAGIFLILVILLFNFFAYTERRFTRWEGGVLVLFYLFFVFVQVIAAVG